MAASESGEHDDDLPDDFRCALSLECFREPVVLVQSGQTYERADLLLALAVRPGVDPQTNVRFDGEPQLVTNIQLRRAVETWRQNRRARPGPSPPPSPRALSLATRPRASDAIACACDDGADADCSPSGRRSGVSNASLSAAPAERTERRETMACSSSPRAEERAAAPDGASVSAAWRADEIGRAHCSESTAPSDPPSRALVADRACEPETPRAEHATSEQLARKRRNGARRRSPTPAAAPAPSPDARARGSQPRWRLLLAGVAALIVAGCVSLATPRPVTPRPVTPRPVTPRPVPRGASAPAATGPKTVFVKTVTGETVSFVFAASDPIDDVKRALQERTGIPPRQQRLFFAGQVLQDGSTLGDYGFDSARSSLIRMSLDVSQIPRRARDAPK